MNEPTMETLARRLDRVERENRRMKQAGMVALAVIAAVVLMGQATTSKVAEVIEAEKFVLRDKSGKTRAFLGVGDEGTVVLDLNDQDEKIVVNLAVTAKGDAVLSFVKNDEVHVGLTFNDATRLSSLILLDDDGKESVMIVSGGVDNAPTLSLAYKNGGSGITLGFLPDVPSLAIYDRKGKNRVKLSLGFDESPTVSIIDKDGKRRAVLGGVSLEGQRTGVVEKRPESSLVLFNKDGEAIWSAP